MPNETCPPLYVLSRRGGFKKLHRRIARTLSCKACGAELERTPSASWVCPRDLTHGKAVPEVVMLRRLKHALARYYPRFTAQGILRLRHKVLLWQARKQRHDQVVQYTWRRVQASIQQTFFPDPGASPCPSTRKSNGATQP